MSNTTRIFLVRHDATVLTAEDRFAGATDALLSDEGREQAVRLGLRLSGESIVAVYASPLARTMETSRMHLQAPRLGRAGPRRTSRNLAWTLGRADTRRSRNEVSRRDGCMGQGSLHLRPRPGRDRPGRHGPRLPACWILSAPIPARRSSWSRTKPPSGCFSARCLGFDPRRTATTSTKARPRSISSISAMKSGPGSRSSTTPRTTPRPALPSRQSLPTPFQMVGREGGQLKIQTRTRNNVFTWG